MSKSYIIKKFVFSKELSNFETAARVSFNASLVPQGYLYFSKTDKRW